jgi:hypothetical protein
MKRPGGRRENSISDETGARGQAEDSAHRRLPMKTYPLNARRNFLLAAGLGAAIAATVVAAPSAHSEDAPVAGRDADGACGYRASEHVLKYYKTTWM